MKGQRVRKEDINDLFDGCQIRTHSKPGLRTAGLDLDGLECATVGDILKGEMFA